MSGVHSQTRRAQSSNNEICSTFKPWMASSRGSIYVGVPWEQNGNLQWREPARVSSLTSIYWSVAQDGVHPLLVFLSDLIWLLWSSIFSKFKLIPLTSFLCCRHLCRNILLYWVKIASSPAQKHLIRTALHNRSILFNLRAISNCYISLSRVYTEDKWLVVIFLLCSINRTHLWINYWALMSL